MLSTRSFEECCVIAQQRRHSLKHESWYPQHLWIAQQISGEYRLMVDLVLRYESLKEGMATISANKLGCGPINLPNVNVSSHGSYHDYYNEKTQKIVADLYFIDIELLGYVF